jgi:hypothetical protein
VLFGCSAISVVSLIIQSMYLDLVDRLLVCVCVCVRARTCACASSRHCGSKNGHILPSLFLHVQGSSFPTFAWLLPLHLLACFLTVFPRLIVTPFHIGLAKIPSGLTDSYIFT